MAYLKGIAKQLLNYGTVSVATSYGAVFQVVLSRPCGFIDLVLTNNYKAMGFITLKNEGAGKYSIVNDTTVNEHYSFINTPGYGIEVKQEYRNRGIGGWFICLAVHLIRRERNIQNKSKRFMIVASDITSEGLGCYRKFGFTIREGMSVSTAYYVCPENLPEKEILPQPVSFWVRLRQRIKL